MSAYSQVVASQKEDAAQKRLQLVSNVEIEHRLLFGDARLINVALSNYLHNAIRFTEIGKISVCARVCAEESDQVVVRFEVLDTGIGIESHDIARLFSVFEQVDNTSTRKFGGLGLGLAITRRLAQLMGGDAGCNSQPDAGSTFWFTISLKKHCAL